MLHSYINRVTGEEVDPQKSAAAGLPVDAQGFKTNQMGNDIDSFLASIFGGPQPTPQEPQPVIVPTRGDGRSAVNNGIQVAPVPKPVGSVNTGMDMYPSISTTNKPVESVSPIAASRGGPVKPKLPSGPMEPRPPVEPRQVSTQVPPAQAQKVSTGTPPVTKTAAVTEASAPGTSRPIDQQSGLEKGMNVFGNVVDDVVDEFGNVVNEAVNIGDRFINRPGPERASRITGRDADIQAWNDKYSGNIGTELLDAIQARGGWGSALGGMTDEVKNFVMDLFDPNRGGTANVASNIAPQSPPVTSEPNNVLDDFDAKVTDRNMTQLQNMPPSPTGRAEQLAALRKRIDDPNTASTAPPPPLPGPQTQNKSELNVDPATLGEDQTLALGRHPYPLGAPVDSDTAHISLEDIVPTTDQIPDAVRNLPGFNAETGVVTLDPNDPNAIIALANALAGASEAQRTGVLNRLDQETKTIVLAKLDDMDEIKGIGTGDEG